MPNKIDPTPKTFEIVAKEEDKKPEFPGAPELSTLTGWWDFAIESSRKKRWDYFVVDQFLRGNHSIRGNTADNTVVVARSSESVNFPINKIYTTFRAVRAFVTRHKPFITVEPYSYDKAAIDYARYANKVLDRDNTLNNFREINKEWVYYGVKYGVGYRQVGWDKTNHKAIRWTIDPFDLAIVSKFGKMEDAPAVIKTFQRPLDYMKKKFSKCEFAPDNELSPDPYKQMSLQLRYQEGGAVSDQDKQTVTAYEAWFRVLEPNTLGGTINKVVFTRSTICDFDETPLTEYPFIPYYAEIMPNEVSGDGHLRHVIPAQRLFNLLNTQLIEYNHIVNRGRFLLDKNSGFRVINTKEGQLIFRNPGKKIESLAPPAVNPLLERQLNMTENFIQELGGQHDASQGASPDRVYSGKGIEQLQQGDSNNISDLRDNFEDALAKEAAMVLLMYSLFEKDGVVVHAQNGSTSESFVAVGHQAYEKTGTELPETIFIDDQNYNVTAILPQHNVKASVTSQLGETKEDRINLMVKLVELGVMPGKALLAHLEFPNVADLTSQLADEVASEIVAENLKGQQGQQPAGPGQVPPGAEGDTGPLAPPMPPGQAPQTGAGNIPLDNPQLLAELEQLAQETGGFANG